MTERRKKDVNTDETLIMKDIFGQYLLDYQQGRHYPCFIRRDDGYVDKSDLGIYFTPYSQWSYCEKEALKYADGKVLDIGAGAGRHSLYLQQK